DPDKFMHLVKAGFGEKRKTLRNSLAGGLRMNAGEVGKLLTKAKLPENARAQELSFDQWYQLYKEFLNSL
ncbi:ribosomal RNA small subunit methyltransferase A, partial [Candidatus Saccharibacteria bacterium]|nr:ribosomal RNA small subunit methyltransferase A [Candidatus Saccharibacteria bacterium]